MERELTTRSGTSFRAEWHATPDDLRRDHWYYLSSKGYLFANAVHFPDMAFPSEYVRPHVTDGGRVLDFGAGTGNLALLLAASGVDVWVSELNALQRDFVRFRIAEARAGRARDRRGAVESCRRGPSMLWWQWTCSSTCRIAAVCWSGSCCPRSRRRACWWKNSPFVVNAANPMHHEDFGFEPFMREAGFELVTRGADETRVWRRSR